MQQLFAYHATFALLEELATMTGSDYWDVVAGSMQLLSDGRPIDQGVAAEWSRAVNEVMGYTDRECTEVEAFHICAAWLGDLYRSTGAPELPAVVTEMKSVAPDMIPEHLNGLWRRCCQRASAGEVDVWLRLVRPDGSDDSTAR